VPSIGTVFAPISTVTVRYRVVSTEGEGRRGRRKERTWRSDTTLLRHPNPSPPSRHSSDACRLGVVSNFSSSARGEEASVTLSRLLSRTGRINEVTTILYRAQLGMPVQSEMAYLAVCWNDEKGEPALCDSIDISVAVATEKVLYLLYNGYRYTVHYIVAYRSLQAVKELAEKARAGKLKPDQYQGGSFR
ncbi:hypothetical protein BHE74_00023441, partial [Ensete ventricosum]